MINNPFHKYRNLLKEYIKPQTIPLIYNNWTKTSRYYHNLDHLNEVITYIEKWKHRFTRSEFEQLILAAFFHDAIYDPRSPETNEDKSKKFFRDSYIGKNERFSLVDDAIDCTKERKKPSFFPLKIFWEADNQVFRKDWLNVLRWERGIRKEYSYVPDDTYKKARIKFLEENRGIFGAKGDTNINKLIKYLQDK